MHRIPGVAVVAALACVVAFSAAAQTPAQDAAGRMQDFLARELAVVIGVGELTREEADGKMPMVARSFDQIDKAHRGYVTQEDIQVFMRERMAQHRSGSQGATN